MDPPLLALSTTSKDKRCGAFLTAIYIPLHGLGLDLTPVILRHHIDMQIANLDSSYFCRLPCLVCDHALSENIMAPMHFPVDMVEAGASLVATTWSTMLCCQRCWCLPFS